MNKQFIGNDVKNYITHTILNGEAVIPSDTFELKGSEYVLLRILQSTDGIIFLKIMGIYGPNTGKIYLIPKHEFEQDSISNIEEILSNYQH
jgi:hypothetical protein